MHSISGEMERGNEKAVNIKAGMAGSVNEAQTSKEDIIRANVNREEEKEDVVNLTHSVQESAEKESELAEQRSLAR